MVIDERVSVRTAFFALISFPRHQRGILRQGGIKHHGRTTSGEPSHFAVNSHG